MIPSSIQLQQSESVVPTTVPNAQGSDLSAVILATPQAGASASSLSTFSVQSRGLQNSATRDYLQALIVKVTELGNAEVRQKLIDIRNSKFSSDPSEEKSVAAAFSLLSIKRKKDTGAADLTQFEIASVLQELSKAHLDALEDISRPDSISNICALAKVYQKIPNAISNALSDEEQEENFWVIEEILKTLTEEGDLNRAIEFIKKIPPPNANDYGLLKIVNEYSLKVCEDLLKEERIEEANEISENLSEYYQTLARMKISAFLSQNPDTKEQALEIARSIPEKCPKARALMKAGKELEAFNDLFDITYLEADEWGLEAATTFVDIFESFNKAPGLADKMVQAITDKCVRVLVLVKMNRIDEAIALAQSIIDEPVEDMEDFSNMLYEAFDALMESGQLERAIDVARIIRDPCREGCLTKASKAFKEKGDESRASELLKEAELAKLEYTNRGGDAPSAGFYYFRGEHAQLQAAMKKEEKGASKILEES